MEHKIGEIFEYNGEWYQCVKNPTFSCKHCDFYDNKHDLCNISRQNYLCSERSDKKTVIFKKLEKVGEPYKRWLSPLNNIMVQRYRLYCRNIIMPDEPYMYFNAIDNTIAIEIKRTKEDMEEKKIQHYDCFFDKKKSNLKPFDIQKAREGKPVCTRDGRKARILCFDLKNNVCPIVAAVEENNMEVLYHYDTKGLNCYKKSEIDLMMLPEKKEGWVNIVRRSDGSPHMGRGIFQSKEEAENTIKAFSDNLIDTVKISWEE